MAASGNSSTSLKSAGNSSSNITPASPTRSKSSEDGVKEKPAQQQQAKGGNKVRSSNCCLLYNLFTDTSVRVPLPYLTPTSKLWSRQVACARSTNDVCLVGVLHLLGHVVNQSAVLYLAATTVDCTEKEKGQKEAVKQATPLLKRRGLDAWVLGVWVCGRVLGQVL